MSIRNLWVLCSALVVGSIYVLFFLGGATQSEAAKRGVKGFGTVQLKDVGKTSDGGTANFVEIVFADNMRHNRQVRLQVPNQGIFDSLQTGKEITVYYLPEDPDKATIEGAQGMTGVSPPVQFVAWTTLVVGLFCGWRAFAQMNERAAGNRSPEGPVGDPGEPAGAAPDVPMPPTDRGKPRKGGPKITMTRR